MKKLRTLISILALGLLPMQGFSLGDDISADSTGLPGDHFSLPGALELFKKSKSLEEFEKGLNVENNYINNLDLNEDGKIDYVRVVSKKDNGNHVVILQVYVSEKEIQDVATILIEKNGEQSAMVQMVGDEELYGDNRFVEPFEEDGKEEMKQGKGPAGHFATHRIWVNVWFWPCVSYMYAPGYVVWASPWYWGYTHPVRC